MVAAEGIFVAAVIIAKAGLIVNNPRRRTTTAKTILSDGKSRQTSQHGVSEKCESESEKESAREGGGRKTSEI